MPQYFYLIFLTKHISKNSQKLACIEGCGEVK